VEGDHFSIGLTQLLGRLQGQRAELIADVVSDCGYVTSDAATLVDAIQGFVEYLPTLLEVTQGQLQFENETLRRVSPAARIALRPWGRVLFVCPSNAPAPLATIVPASLALAGNHVTIVSPSAIRASVTRCVGLLPTEYSVQLWPGRAADAVSQIARNNYDMVYYTGSSRFFPDISSLCARSGTHLIYEGEGRGVAIISKEAGETDLHRSANALTEALRYCNGKMCSKPTAVAVPAELETSFLELFVRVARESKLPRSAEALLGHTLARFIKEGLDAGDFEALTLMHDDVPYLLRARDFATAIGAEMFGPALTVFTYETIEALRASLASHRYKLQLSWFGPRGDLLATADTAGVARVCANVQPSSQNPSLPWGGYGLSGTSDVLDFYRKGLRRVLCESD